MHLMMVSMAKFDLLVSAPPGDTKAKDLHPLPLLILSIKLVYHLWIFLRMTGEGACAIIDVQITINILFYSL